MARSIGGSIVPLAEKKAERTAVICESRPRAIERRLEGIQCEKDSTLQPSFVRQKCPARVDADRPW